MSNARYIQRSFRYGLFMSVGCVPLEKPASTCHVLLEDSELFEAVPPHARDQAFQDCVAQVLVLPAGDWAADDSPVELPDGIGLLILDGLIIRRTGMDGHFGAELLGGGDLLRPWQKAPDTLTLPLSTSRRVLSPTRVAVLDLAFAARAARYPQISGQLVARTMNRSRNLSVLMAIVHYPRVDTRLHALFWHLSGRWGRVRTDGVLLPLRLTHSVLADLIAARRPTVSSALAELSRRGVLSSSEEGWHLTGEPPHELFDPSTRLASPPSVRVLYPGVTPAEAEEILLPHSNGNPDPDISATANVDA